MVITIVIIIKLVMDQMANCLKQFLERSFTFKNEHYRRLNVVGLAENIIVIVPNVTSKQLVKTGKPSCP